MRKVRRDLVDFYGDQVQVCAAGAADVLQTRGDLVQEWTRDGGRIATGYAKRVADSAFVGAEDQRGLAEEIAEFSMSWVIGGLPRVRFSHKLAASLASTSIPREFCEHIEAPWKYFVVVVPAGLLFNPCESSILVRSVRINDECGQREGGASLVRESSAPGERGCRILYQHWCSPEAAERSGRPISGQTACAPWREYAQMADDLGVTMDAELRRSLQWHMRLVFGACLEMQGSDAPPARGTGNVALRVARSGLPKAWNLTLSRSVRIDVRAHARDYVRGSGRTLGKQGIVRGHWKNQPHGPGGTERKFIHIEPYWRGPEDAPIAVRTHVLKGPKGDGATLT